MGRILTDRGQVIDLTGNGRPNGEKLKGEFLDRTQGKKMVDQLKEGVNTRRARREKARRARRWKEVNV